MYIFKVDLTPDLLTLDNQGIAEEHGSLIKENLNNIPFELKFSYEEDTGTISLISINDYLIIPSKGNLLLNVPDLTLEVL